MFRFFRLLRKKLLEEGHIRKYFWYAVGEVFLVVIGILIALQINNWNEQRKYEAKIDNQLLALKEVLLHEKELLQSIQDQHSFRAHSLSKLLEIAELPPIQQNWWSFKEFRKSDIWNDTIPENGGPRFNRLAYRWSTGFTHFFIDKTVIDQLQNSGMLVALENQELNRALNEYYSMADVRFSQVEIPQNNPVIAMWRKELIYDGVVTFDQSLIEDPIALFKGHEDREAMLRSIAINAYWLELSAFEIEQRGDSLVAIIDKILED
jgi:hypothetical protein